MLVHAVAVLVSCGDKNVLPEDLSCGVVEGIGIGGMWFERVRCYGPWSRGVEWNQTDDRR